MLTIRYCLQFEFRGVVKKLNAIVISIPGYSINEIKKALDGFIAEEDEKGWTLVDKEILDIIETL